MNKLKACLKLFWYLNILVAMIAAYGCAFKYSSTIIDYIFENTDNWLLKLYAMFVYAFIALSIIAFITPKIKIFDRIIKCLDEMND
jgi:hypothetical protein